LEQHSPSPFQVSQPTDSELAEPTVFVVDDEAVVARSLRWLIESVGLKVATFSSAREFLASYHPQQPGCLILDVRMPGMSGLELQKRLKLQGVTLPIIFITGHGGVQTAVTALQAGAVDFLEKPFDDQRMLDLVQKAIALDAEQRRRAASMADATARFGSLSTRERQVLDQLIDGRTSKEIARALGLSAKTVETYRANVMEKMGVSKVPHLVKLMIDLRGALP
jgi:two-component system, LuxR family, response regulator FixJ